MAGGTVAAATDWTGGGTTAALAGVPPLGGVREGEPADAGTPAARGGGVLLGDWLAVVFCPGRGGVADGVGDALTSTHPSGGEIITMLPHLGHSWICPMALLLRTASRARHVVQDTENSDFSTLMRLNPLPAGPSQFSPLTTQRPPLLATPHIAIVRRGRWFVRPLSHPVFGSVRIGPVRTAWFSSRSS